MQRGIREFLGFTFFVWDYAFGHDWRAKNATNKQKR